MKRWPKLILPIFALTRFSIGLAAADTERETASKPPAKESAAAVRKLDPLENLIRAKAKLSVTDVISIAIKLAESDSLASGGHRPSPEYDLSLFDAPKVHATIFRDAADPQRFTPPPPKIIWKVRFERTGADFVAPRTNIEITVADDTGKATFDIQM